MLPNNKFTDSSKHSMMYNLVLPMILFGSIGAISWAIRGTAGWGGVDGTVLPGLMWGILWYYLSAKKGIDARHIVLWLGLGLALGGELGYGQYTGWIQGNFQVGNEIMPLNPGWGYAWLIMCGIGWAAPGAIILGWALGKSISTGKWIVRSVWLFGLLFVLFDWSMIEKLATYFVKIDPGVLFPYSDLGIYSSDLGKNLSRTIYTNTQNLLAVVWWLGAVLIAALQRDKTTLITGLIIGGGFGLGFMQSTIWTLGYATAPKYIDWWKIWELNAGFNLGMLYAITFYWFNGKTDKQILSANNGSCESMKVRKKLEWRTTLFLALGGFILIYFTGFEYFFGMVLVLGILYIVSMILTTVGTSDAVIIGERRKNVLLIYSIFFLVYLMFHGGSERLGIILELYNEDAVSQYSWPLERIILFTPFALVIFSVTIYHLWKILRPDALHLAYDKISFDKSFLIVDLMTVMGFIGALSIWPLKIGVLYALFLCFAIWSFNRLNNY